jgi:hypothetical protein
MGRTPPDAFVYRAGMSADEIPVERVTPRELGVTEPPRRSEYTKVPSAFYSRFQPADRLLLCLIFARDVFGEDAPGGWTKLGSGLTGRFGLTDRDVRRRAVEALERGDFAEVRRRKGACTFLRLKADQK